MWAVSLGEAFLNIATKYTCLGRNFPSNLWAVCRTCRQMDKLMKDGSSVRRPVGIELSRV